MSDVQARHYLTGEQWNLTFHDRIVAELTTGPAAQSNNLWICPLLVDLQINGQRGLDFLQPGIEVDAIHRLALDLDQDGVAAALATVTTQSGLRLEQALGKIAAARAQAESTRQRLPGVHLEGPYLSPHDGPRGAHPREHIRPPDWDEFCRFQEAAAGAIRLVTLSPEYPEAPRFIQQCRDSGVLVSIGHTAATSEQIRAAADAGATLSTHLGNGAHGILPRHPNYLWDQLADDRLTAMVIADGHHLPDEVLKCIVRCKSPARVVAVSDLTGLGGMPPGRYPETSLGDVEVLDNGKLVVGGQTQYLAGAARPLWMAIPRLLHATDLSLPQVIDSVSRIPGHLIGRPQAVIRNPQTLSAIIFRWSPNPDLKTGEDPVTGFELLHVIREGRRVT